jgi:hypothetical protein
MISRQYSRDCALGYSQVPTKAIFGWNSCAQKRIGVPALLENPLKMEFGDQHKL